MSKSQTTGETSRHITSLPTIEIPKDIQPDEYGHLKFQIEAAGGIEVTCSWHNLYAKGTAAALAAYGLLQTDWLPGLPGNNKVTQTVVFEEGRAVLFKMRNQHHAPKSRIAIDRLSKSKALATYSVCVPTTKEQQEEFVKMLRASIS